MSEDERNEKVIEVADFIINTKVYDEMFGKMLPKFKNSLMTLNY